MPSSPSTGLTAQDVAERIQRIRGQNVLLDVDLATLYGVSTGRLNEQVKRNFRRFPADFTFRLTSQEVENLKSQNAISSGKAGSWGGRRRSLPLAFTEHGALMAANILSSRRAIEMSIFVVRAFVQLRHILTTNKKLAEKLDELERKVERLAVKHDVLAAGTHAQFKQLVDALRQLMSAPPPTRRPIGFVTPTT